jgi:predicted Zn-dependent protease
MITRTLLSLLLLIETTACSIVKKPSLLPQLTKKLAEEQYHLNRSRYEIYEANDPRTALYLKKIKAIEWRLRRNSGISDIVGNYYFLRTDAPIAFAGVAGNIYISERFLTDGSSPYREDQLAAVLAHEISHILHKHPEEIIESRSSNYSIEIEFTHTNNYLDYEKLSYMIAQNAAIKGGNKTKKAVKILQTSPSSTTHYSTSSSIRPISLSGANLTTPLLGGYSQASEFQADDTTQPMLVSAGFSSNSFLTVLREQRDRMMTLKEDTSAITAINERIERLYGRK